MSSSTTLARFSVTSDWYSKNAGIGTTTSSPGLSRASIAEKSASVAPLVTMTSSDPYSRPLSAMCEAIASRSASVPALGG